MNRQLAFPRRWDNLLSAKVDPIAVLAHLAVPARRRTVLVFWEINRNWNRSGPATARRTSSGFQRPRNSVLQHSAPALHTPSVPPEMECSTISSSMDSRNDHGRHINRDRDPFLG